jgi:anti-sigma-K factor RskA
VNERLSDYLLGELEGAERQRFEAELARDPALAAEAERLRPVITRLESLDPSAWELPEAPPLPRIAPPASAAAPERRPAWWRRALVVRPLAAATLAVVLLALGVGAGLLLGGGGGDDGADGGRVIALDPVEPLGGDASGTATISAKDGRATVKVRGLEPSAQGDFYELWLLNSPDDLVSLGSFRVPASGAVDVSVPLPANPDAFAALDVSVEPPDGNPAHSSRSVLRAPLAPA